MLRIKDEFALGAIAGVLATIPQLLFDFISVQIGYSNYYAFQISAGIYLYEALTITPLGLIFGGFIWQAMAMLLGVITVFIMKYFGKDYWWLKGLGVSTILMFTIIYGFLFTLGAAKIIPFDLPTNVTVFMGNVIFGLTMSYLIIRLEGDILPPV